MVIRVLNTLSGKKEEFRHTGDTPVRVYVCGVTPYADTHIGHARPSVFWDVVRRYLEYKGYRVNLVQNFTDIDDKVINKALESGQDALSISRHHSDEYLGLMHRLGVKDAEVYPRVSEHIPDIIKVIEGLLERGVAYERDGNVWYDISRFPDYGKLSHRPLDELRAGARVEVNPDKRNPGDFALWKKAKPGEPSWPSPWGPGRPGWHIECSTMALKYLGSDFDFHGGGTDLIFPHHENEIAQSEAYTGQPFCRFWVHNEMLNLRGVKMSKSLGNVISLREALDKAPSGVIRMLLLGAHYRKAVEFGFDLVEENQRAWRRLNDAVGRLREAVAEEETSGSGSTGAGFTKGEPEAPPEDVLDLAGAAAEARRKFEQAMDDDFNTAGALAALFDLARQVNAALVTAEAGPGIKAGAREALAVMEELGGGVLGVVEPTGEATEAQAGAADVSSLLDLLVEVRKKLRSEKNFALSDFIRDSLGELGYEVQDSPSGTTIRRKE